MGSVEAKGDFFKKKALNFRHTIMLSPCDDPTTEYPFQHVVLTGFLPCKTHPKRMVFAGDFTIIII